MIKTKYQSVLDLLLKDLENNLERLDQLKEQYVQIQQFDYDANVKELVKGLEFIKRHVDTSIKKINKN